MRIEFRKKYNPFMSIIAFNVGCKPLSTSWIVQ